VVRGVGSGFVMEHDGLIATNNHVVEGAKVLNVTFYDGKKYPAVVVGTDPSTDLAVVRIQAPRQAGLKLATPESLQVGEYVVAMGSPLGLQQTVTMGVLSALDRDIGMDTRVGFLQTDAPINPGNSGGPLMNLSGEVLGINSAVAQSAQGIGFATPVGTLRSVLPQLAAGVKVDKAWFGARTANVPGDPARMTYPRRTGVLVTGLEQGSPASQGGLQAGDVLVQINGRPIEDSGTLMQVLAPLDAGSHVTMVVARQGVARTVAITLGTPPRG
jgi:S1-C subfamily serine protease